MSTNSLFIRLIVAVMVAVAAVACSTADREKELVEEAMRQAGDNARELQAVLDRYDDERRELAQYAVAATRGRIARTGAVGIIYPHNTIDKQFLLVNQGSQPITIQEIVPSCDCVSAVSSSMVIPPDSTSVITMTLAVDSIPGSTRRYADVYYNEKDNPERITLHGYIVNTIQ